MMHPATVRSALPLLCLFVGGAIGAPSDPMMEGFLGSYPAAREASGTSWEPDDSAHGGNHLMAGDWMLMSHTLLNGVDDWQQGPRGGTDTFLSGMVMGMAGRHFTTGDALQLRAMLSPEPLMGKSGYPLLLATGETANGSTPLVDRQHPHDLFMELSASYSRPLTAMSSGFIYVGLPGEPAFGPPAFMHRQSILDSPEAPITHHWLDSTHVTFGVVTAGYVNGDWKFEGSRFRGREPDEFRYNLEYGALNSSSARVSWNPRPDLALQASWAELVSPEQLAPQQDQHRWSASALYTRAVDAERWWATTVAWGRRRNTGAAALDAVAIETAVKPSVCWTLFVRGERERNDELILTGAGTGVPFTVGRVSVGVIRDWPVADALLLGIGAQVDLDFVPRPLSTLYGRSDPAGAMAFLRLKSR